MKEKGTSLCPKVFLPGSMNETVEILTALIDLVMCEDSMPTNFYNKDKSYCIRVAFLKSPHQNISISFEKTLRINTKTSQECSYFLSQI